jgi:predicted house-cleaning noncanonical NTP pyrophosphatase (MazG superfamily)
VGKLVRDRIPEIMRADGRDPDVRVLSEPEYWDALLAKLLEEADELREASYDGRLEEAADVYEVLLAIVGATGSSLDDLQSTAERKRRERGGFRDRIWLERW